MANEIQILVTIDIRPKPALGTIETGAVALIRDRIPKGYLDILAIDPLPIGVW